MLPNRRNRTWAKAASLAALVMLVASMIPGTAIAATPSWTMQVTALPSSVKPGELAGFRVKISNTGNSNISQVYLSNGLSMLDGTVPVTALPAFAPPSVLPIAYVATSQGRCDPVDTTAPITDVKLYCALGAIRSNKSATVTVAYDSKAYPVIRPIFEANTTGVAGDNPGSSHGDVLQGYDTTTPNPDGDFGGRFVTAGQQAVSDDQTLGSSNLQYTKVTAPAVGIGVTVADGDQVVDTCPSTIGCWTEASELNVADGAVFPKLFKVEIGIHKDLSQTVDGIYHEFDGPQLIDGVLTSSEIIDTKCAKNGTPSEPCYIVTKLGGNDILITVWLDRNGKLYGF